MSGLRELLRGYTETGALPDTAVSGIATHSASVRAGDLFLAMPGVKAHGLRFCDEAVKRGAVAVCWDGEFDGATPDAGENPPLVRVPDLRAKAGHIAARFYGEPSAQLQVVAVTGTNGKTSVAHIVAQALEARHGACGLIGTLGCGTVGDLHDTRETTPDAPAIHRELAELRGRGVGHVVMEASSHGLDQSRLAGVRVDVAALTNLGRDHFDYHKTPDDYAASKKKLFEMEGLRVAALNADDAFGLELKGFCAGRGTPMLMYSMQGGADVVGETLGMDGAGIRMAIVFRDERVEVGSRLTGIFNASNLLAAFTVLMALDCGVAEAARLLSEVGQVPGRMQLFSAEHRPLVVVDYAHTPEAMESVLLSAREMCAGRIICVFGCGGERDRGKRLLMGEVASRLCDKSVLTDDNPRNESPKEIVAGIFAGMRDVDAGRVVTIHDRTRAIEYAIKDGTDKDCVLVLGKGHENTQDFGDRVVSFNDADVVSAMFAHDAGSRSGDRGRA